MGLRQPGTVGIVPAGALGVAFFHHLGGAAGASELPVRLVAREGSGSALALREAGILRIESDGAVREIRARGIWMPPLVECAHEGWLPDFLLVCTQPDQLLGVMSSSVRLLEALVRDLEAEEAVAAWPVHILCSNGIYFQRVRQFFIERVEESVLFGRIPDLWPRLMPQLVGKLLRGVTIQTGHREGSGAAAIYKPGARGRTRLAGGDAAERERAAAVLSGHGGWFEIAEGASPTRVEFDKALVNLIANLLGQLRAIQESGEFHLLQVREVLGPEDRPEARTLAERVLEVGRAVNAYAPQDDAETIFAAAMTSCEQYLDHVPSSVQWIATQLERGTLRAEVTPTEKWLLEPLIRYARAAGLEDAAQYFEELARRVEDRIARAISFHGRAGTGG